MAFLVACLLCLEADVSARPQEEQALAAARSLIQQNKNAEAIAQLKALAARKPRMKGLSHELGVAYYREGEYLEAAKHLQEAWKEDPEDRNAA